jgi:hypothetical protein
MRFNQRYFTLLGSSPGSARARRHCLAMVRTAAAARARAPPAFLSLLERPGTHYACAWMLWC